MKSREMNEKGKGSMALRKLSLRFGGGNDPDKLDLVRDVLELKQATQTYPTEVCQQVRS
jgi:hypothetical protein